MKLTATQLKGFRSLPNSGYDKFKVEFLFHSNKLEGSTFTREQIYQVMKANEVSGQHSLNDVYETKNSIDLFEFLVDTIDEPLSTSLIKEYHAILMRNSADIIHSRLAGKYRPMHAEISHVDLKLSDPATIHSDMDQLLSEFSRLAVVDLKQIVLFHQRFEHIHPFHDGNGRIGRFIIIKQCIDYGVDLIAVDSEYEKEYKTALYLAQTTNDIDPLMGVFNNCQQRLNEKVLYIEEVKQMIDKIFEERSTYLAGDPLKSINLEYLDADGDLNEPMILIDAIEFIPFSLFIRNNKRGIYEDHVVDYQLYGTHRKKIIHGKLKVGKSENVINTLQQEAIKSGQQNVFMQMLQEILTNQ